MRSNMKPILLILTISLFWQVSFCQKTITWVNLFDLYDSTTLDLKVGPHKIIVRKSNNRKVSYDTLPVQVMPDTNTFAINYLPLANAGNDTTFILGKTGQLSGKGFDVDGKIIGWYWKKAGGPSKGKISYSNRQTTTLTGLVAGIYKYHLTVTDNNGGSASDEVIITVK